MKRLPIWIVGLLMLVGAGSLAAEEAGSHTAVIRVDGLSCPFCAYGLEKHLKRVRGVARVTIDMKGGSATVTLKPDAVVDDAALREAVKKAGFSARAIRRR